MAEAAAGECEEEGGSIARVCRGREGEGRQRGGEVRGEGKEEVRREEKGG